MPWANEPVRGISVQDAEQYCKWLFNNISDCTDLIDHLDSQGFELLDALRLPHLRDLQAALTGTDLRRPHWRTTGVFGHRNLICHTWQYTIDGRIFGGSRELGGPFKFSDSDSLEALEHCDLAQKVYESHYPQGIGDFLIENRDPTFGFRVCLPIFELDGGVKEISTKLINLADSETRKFLFRDLITPEDIDNEALVMDVPRAGTSTADGGELGAGNSPPPPEPDVDPDDEDERLVQLILMLLHYYKRLGISYVESVQKLLSRLADTAGKQLQNPTLANQIIAFREQLRQNYSNKSGHE